MTTPPVDVLKMSCADYSNVFLKPIVLKLVVYYMYQFDLSCFFFPEKR